MVVGSGAGSAGDSGGRARTGWIGPGRTRNRRARNRRTRAEGTLRPVRTFLPRRGSLLKAALVTALLAMAAGLLWLPDPRDASGPATSPSGPDLSRSAPPAGPVQVAGGDVSAGPPAPLGSGSPWPGPPWPESAWPESAWPESAPSPGSAPSGAGPSAGTGPAPPAGTVGVPVRMTEPAVLAVVRPGTRIDLMQVPAPDGTRPATPTPVAEAALVLDVVDPGAGESTGALYLALAPEQAHRVLLAPPDARFAVLIRP